MAEKVMIQDTVKQCPDCGGGLRRICTQKDILFVCSRCNITLKIVGKGQSEREVECEVIR